MRCIEITRFVSKSRDLCRNHKICSSAAAHFICIYSFFHTAQASAQCPAAANAHLLRSDMAGSEKLRQPSAQSPYYFFMGSTHLFLHSAQISEVEPLNRLFRVERRAGNVETIRLGHRLELFQGPDLRRSLSMSTVMSLSSPLADPRLHAQTRVSACNHADR